MKIEFNAQQKESQQRFRAFAAEHLAPHAEGLDRELAFPRELADTIARAGHLASQVPQEYGGRGLDRIRYGLLHEEFGKACSSTRTLLTVHDMVAEAVLRFGGSRMRETWLRRLTSGEQLAAFALTEPEAGSDAAAIRTTAVENEGGYVLTGRKKWISFGQIADVFLLFARIGKDGPIGGFLVGRDTPGLTITPIRGMLGLRGSMLAELDFDACRIPAETRLGPARMPEGLLAATALQLGRYSVAWGCVAIGQACLEASFRYSSDRTQFGVPLAQHQLIRRILTDMLVEVRAARLLCLDAGHLQETHHAEAVQSTLIAKYFASRMANRVASNAVQVHGALGVSDQRPVERHFRDARVMEIIEGSTEIQQITIAKYGVEQFRADNSKP